jgi:mitochondrial chaperone BCS1
MAQFMDQASPSPFQQHCFQSNSTKTTALGSALISALESIIPGYAILSNSFQTILRLNLSATVSYFFLILAFIASVPYLFNWSYSSVFFLLTSSIVIPDDDDLYEVTLKWIAAHPSSKTSRSLRAVTPFGVLEGIESMLGKQEEQAAPKIHSDQDLFDLGKKAARRKPRFEPYSGLHPFWHNGRYFFYRRSYMAITRYETQPEQVELLCLGRSTQPIKDLIEHIEGWSVEREKTLTIIHRPEPTRDGVPCSDWDHVCERLSRPIDSVILDATHKRKLMEDMKEFLQPETQLWYATCGIPYRRGYLFHGPPGTGKTSLSFALAGLFGLDIYVVSLMDRSLTESDLVSLLCNLPQRCIVLLEDIDSAGLRSDSAEENGLTEEDSSTSPTTGAHPTRSYNLPSRHGFSLSGLLNAIDGVTSHEGRVLILTTNFPEKLDAALLRPGRVDLQIEFKLASNEQLREIFIRVYSGGNYRRAGCILDDRNQKVRGNGMEQSDMPLKRGQSLSTLEDSKIGAVVVSDTSNCDLEAIADTFAGHFPQHTFSPAEVQGYLLMHKKSPSEALEHVDKWRDSLLEAKSKGRKTVRLS